MKCQPRGRRIRSAVLRWGVIALLISDTVADHLLSGVSAWLGGNIRSQHAKGRDAASGISYTSRWLPPYTSNHGMLSLVPLIQYRTFTPAERQYVRERVPPVPLEPHPILFIPPMMATGLEYRLHDKQDSSHWWCRRNQQLWTSLWVNFADAVPGWFACFVDIMRLAFDPVTGLSGSPPGVEVRPANENGSGTLIMMGELTKSLEHLGWQIDRDLLSHGYDWRLTPRDWRQPGGSFERLKAFIQDAVAARGGRKVIVYGISLGCSYFGSFLSTYVDEPWKAAYIQGFISISGVWGGTPRAAQEMLQPWLYGVDKVLDRQQLVRLVQGLPSISWLMPAVELFGREGAYVNTARNKTYTAATMGELLNDAGAQQAADVWSWAKSETLLPAPNVTMYCIYSLGLPTIRGFTSTAADFSSDLVDLIYGDGDVTVPKESISHCEEYKASQDMPVYTFNYEGFEHAMMMNDPSVLVDVLRMVVDLNSKGGAQRSQGQVL